MKAFMRKRLIYSFNSLILATVTVVSLSLLGVNSHKAAAQSIDSLDRLFTIQAVKVDVRARRASDAQRTAIARAEQEAYGKLLIKITQPAGRAMLPTLSPAEIRALISGIEIVSEQSSSRRYIATLDVRFEPGNVSRFLAQHNVPHVLSAGRGLIVLHAHKDSITDYLWQSNAETTAAKGAVDWLNRIRKYIFPRGELRERRIVTYGEAAALHTAGARQLAKLYKVQSYLIISSQWTPTNKGGFLQFQFFSSDDQLHAQAKISAEGPFAQRQSLNQMFEQILVAVDSAWQEQLLVDTGTGGNLTVLLPTTELAILAEVERRLADVTLVQDVTLLSVGLPFTRMRFRYTGRVDQLVLAMKFAGLSLSEYGDEKLLSPIEQN